MSCLLDTNAISELQLKKINQGFWEWWSPFDQVNDDVFLCAPVIGELLRGVRLPKVSHTKRRELLRWIEENVLKTFQGRILPFDETVARTWSEVAAAIPRGRVLPVLDSYIAAIAIHHGLTLVTRDTADMAVFKGLKLHSPWT